MFNHKHKIMVISIFHCDAMIIMISVSWKPPVMVIRMFYHDQQLWWWTFVPVLQLNACLPYLISFWPSYIIRKNCLMPLIIFSTCLELCLSELQVNEPLWLSEHVRCTLITPSRNQPTKWINTIYYKTLIIWSELFLHYPLNPKLASTSSMP